MSNHTGNVADLDLTVHRRQILADGVLLLELRAPQGTQLPPWQPGAHIDLVLDDDLVRQYSLCGDPGDRQTWQIAVLREAEGRGGSCFIHDKLAEGDVVRVRGPRNHFTLLPSPRYLFIGGGIGITPLIPMMAAATAAGADWHLTYGGRSRASMAFLDTLTETYGERVTIHPQDTSGLIDLEGLLGTPAADTLVYSCGPGPLLDAVAERCATWPAGSLHIERFAAVGLSKPVWEGPFEVEIAGSGRVFTVPPEKSVLEVLRTGGIDVDYSCSEGTCGSCEVAVVDGLVDHRDAVLSPEERAEGKLMMICVSRAACPRLVLDVDA